MKKLILFLVLSAFIINCNAELKLSSQATTFPVTHVYKHKYAESWKTTAVYVFSIVANATGDALNDKGEKTFGHVCNGLSIASLVSAPLILDIDKSKWGAYAASYICLRIGLFDGVYNTVRGLPVNYVGTSAVSDKLWTKSKQRPDLFFKAVFLTVGVSIPFNYLSN